MTFGKYFSLGTTIPGPFGKNLSKGVRFSPLPEGFQSLLAAALRKVQPFFLDRGFQTDLRAASATGLETREGERAGCRRTPTGRLLQSVAIRGPAQPPPPALNPRQASSAPRRLRRSRAGRKFETQRERADAAGESCRLQLWPAPCIYLLPLPPSLPPRHLPSPAGEEGAGGSGAKPNLI